VGQPRNAEKTTLRI